MVDLNTGLGIMDFDHQPAMLVIRTKRECSYNSPHGRQDVPIGTIGMVLPNTTPTGRYRIVLYPSGQRITVNKLHFESFAEIVHDRAYRPDLGMRKLSEILRKVYRESMVDTQNSTLLLSKELYDNIITTSSWLNVGVPIRKILFYSGLWVDDQLEISFDDMNKIAELVGFNERLHKNSVLPKIGMDQTVEKEEKNMVVEYSEPISKISQQEEIQDQMGFFKLWS